MRKKQISNEVLELIGSHETTNMMLKQCRFCRHIFPATQQYFTKSGKHGVASKCKACHSLMVHNRLVIINPFAPKDGYRGCKTCLRRLPDTEENFYADSRKPDWTSHECKDCAKKRHSTYNDANKEMLSEYRKQWVKNNHLHVLDYFRAYRMINEEKVKQWQKDWRKKNPDRERLQWQNREARKRALPDTFTTEDYEALKVYWNGACAISGETKNIHLDHWIPLASSQCPGTTADNLVPLVDYLNFSKNDTHPMMWLQINFGDAEMINQRIQDYFTWVRQRKNG